MTDAAAQSAIAVTIAGSDSGGGAGIQADIKTFSALGVYGASVITALTAQNTLGVTGIHDVPPAFITQQIEAVYSDLDVAATKIGMLSRPEAILAVASGLDRHQVANVVLDPVMVAASGDRLLVAEAIATLRAELLPRARLITPNLPEAAALLDEPQATSLEEVRAQAERLLALGPKAVLVKGGHSEGPESVDVLMDADGVHEFRGPRINTQNTHGTGCTLSSAIAAGLAKGEDLRTSVQAAKHYLSRALARSDELHIGHGHGPVHHFHAFWS
ncbi:bifunctional hydroxymethylpyrimidine kinase/phosphomethylpyrimidine kinase [Ancylobacter sp. MQZ15Z-1]|uniref:hydroxymethylpyrimidine kinase n=1 Tax=Ancylobacter mangrovi TaxID=2972472 RepID=A0A9X2PCA6_9HYPH|nr:bifunctional hydroxymethylpyrimidine kinase/phosphomethylpyrimidine kinase [Ancylobacter mangrovi]MCS0496152.1 bifunctional hydroxymethylpyrimidine kinase/phosphomethylpyrimidine kinase [Ancylobacter mangrovi]